MGPNIKTFLLNFRRSYITFLGDRGLAIFRFLFYTLESMGSLTEKSRGIDAVLVHVYGYDKRRPEALPDLRGRLQVSAA